MDRRHRAGLGAALCAVLACGSSDAKQSDGDSGGDAGQSVDPSQVRDASQRADGGAEMRDSGASSSRDGGDSPNTQDAGGPDASGMTLKCGGWYDSTSRLCWEVSPSSVLRDFKASIAYCDALSLNGHTDWRLPNLTEARTIIEGCPATEPGGVCQAVHGSKQNVSIDPCTGCGVVPNQCRWNAALMGSCDKVHWTASPVPDQANAAWVVEYFAGAILNTFDQETYYARCVRGPL